MSQQNVEVVRGIYDALDSGDVGLALSAIDPEVVWDLSNHSWPGDDQYFGHEGIVEVLSEWMGAFEDYTIKPERFIDAGDRVVVIQRETARHKGTDTGIDRRQASIYTMRDRRAIRIDHYLDIPQALEAAGLSEQAMSHENVEVVRRVHDAAGRRDTATVLSLYDPSVECDYSRVSWGDPAGRGVYHGHEGLRQVFREWHEAWESHKADVEELIDAGDDRVISVGTARGRGKASGIEVELPHQAGLWTIRDGRVIRVVWFPTRAEALEAAGLSE